MDESMAEKKAGTNFFDREDIYRNVLNSLGDAVIITDKNKTIQNLNPAAEKLTGWSRSNAEKTNVDNIFKIINAETGEQVEGPFNWVLKKGDEVALPDNTLLITKEGKEIPAAGNCAAVKNDMGIIVGTVLIFRDQTKERRIEQELRHNEFLLKKSQAIAHVGSWELDVSADRLVWSDEVYRMFGLCPQEFDATYEAFLATVHPDEREGVNTAYSSSLREGRDTYEIIHRIARRDTGKIRIVHEKCEHIKDATGKIVRSIGMVEDITDRMRAQQALRESESKFRSVVESSPMGMHMYQLEENGRLVFIGANPAANRILGVDNSQFIGKTLEEAFPSMADSELSNRYRRAAAQGESWSIEQIFYQDDMITGTFEVHAFQTEPGKMVALFMDITDRKKAEEALRNSEAQYRSLIQNSNDAIYLLYNRKFEIINHKFEELMGVTIEDVQKPDFDFMDLVKPDEHPIIEQRMAELSEGKKVAPQYQFTAVRPDGRELIVEASVSYVPYKEGTATQGVLRDVTERIRAENQIRQNLEEKNVLLKEIHHRVKNNLSVVISLLNLQADNLQSKEQAINAFKESRDRIYAMAMVHEQLYQSGNFAEIDMKNYTHTLIQKLLQIYKPSTNIDCDFKIQAVKIDINQAIPLGLILNELITNVLKHAFQDRLEGNLFISLKQLKNGPYDIIVQDDGMGLPEHIDPENVESLGFKLVKILTEQLDGKLLIDRKSGTKFKLVFPIDKK